MPPSFPAIVHLDADAFFVACEQARDPSLRGTRCAVGGRERGIIASASYEARAAGVFTPMPTAQALRVCPDLQLIPPTSGLYGELSKAMFERCENLTPLVQRNSIDEGYLDLSPCGFADLDAVAAAARGLQRRLWEEIGIPVSFGIGRNKLIAQIASKLRKPRGFEVVPADGEAAFLAPLPVGKLPGVGEKTEAALARLGFRRIGDIASAGEAGLKAAFGGSWREMLAWARGEDDRPVETEEAAAKSYSRQETFAADVGDFAAIERTAKGMLDDLMAEIRTDKKRVRTLAVRVRYPDFSEESHARTLPEASDLEEPFYPLVGPLLRAAWRKRRALRLVSLRLSGVEDGSGQLEMFAEGDEKRRRLAAALDQLNRAGRGPVVRRGHQLTGSASK